MNDSKLQPNVASGARPVAETIRQLVDFGIQTIREDIDSPDTLSIIDELFSMWGQDIIDQVKKILREHTAIDVVTGWPQDGLSVPQVCVVTQTEREKPEESFIGDQSGMIGRGAGIQLDENQNFVEEIADNNLTQRQQRGVVIAGITGVFVRAKDPILCIYLTHIVRLIIFMNKMDLIRDGDIHNLTIDIEEVAHNPELFPEVLFTRQIALSYTTQFDYNLPEKIVRRLSLGLLVNPAVINPQDGSVHDEKAVLYPQST